MDWSGVMRPSNLISLWCLPKIMCAKQGAKQSEWRIKICLHSHHCRKHQPRALKIASETLLPLVSGFGLISGLTHIVKYSSYTMLYWYINYSSTGTISTRLQDVENALTSRVKLDRSTFLRLKESIATLWYVCTGRGFITSAKRKCWRDSHNRSLCIVALLGK